jgi:large subunit ribosomal protein L24
MQKLLKRSALARRQVERKYKQKLAQKEKVDQLTRVSQAATISKEYGANKRYERQARREDWNMGNLAPKRDAGDNAGLYGSISIDAMKGVELAPKHRAKIPFEPGDRVVIVQKRHPDQGKIGKIIEVKEENGTVTVEGLNMVCLEQRKK